MPPLRIDQSEMQEKGAVLGKYITNLLIVRRKRKGERVGMLMDGATSCYSTVFRVPRRPGTQIAARFLRGLRCHCHCHSSLCKKVVR
jgi:hypothetical protein